jgi:16S rRNA (uracil1498-N3)-methyltransferase
MVLVGCFAAHKNHHPVEKTMHRFFVPPEILKTNPVVFPEAIARQIAAVLRLRPGQSVILLDNLGWEYEVCLAAVEKRSVTGEVLARRAASPEPGLRLTLFVCLTQREKFELILQKCTELGTAGFIPVISSRSLVQDGGEVSKKMGRWQQIVQEAAEQCGRGRIPTISAAQTWAQALCQAGKYDRCLLAWEEEHALGLKEALTGVSGLGSLAVLIGPEGGLSAKEASEAGQAGFRPVSLGPRILRMETAAIAAAANILFYF